MKKDKDSILRKAMAPLSIHWPASIVTEALSYLFDLSYAGCSPFITPRAGPLCPALNLRKDDLNNCFPQVPLPFGSSRDWNLGGSKVGPCISLAPLSWGVGNGCVPPPQGTAQEASLPWQPASVYLNHSLPLATSGLRIVVSLVLLISPLFDFPKPCPHL